MSDPSSATPTESPSSGQGGADPEPGGEAEGSRRAPSRGPLLALVLLLGIIGALSFALFSGSKESRLPAGARQSAAGGGFLGTLALPAKPAPPIQLRNYLGQPVTLAEYRGKAVLVTFLYTHCPDVCPLIASNLRVALGLLGARAAKVQVIAVSVDPRGDRPAAVGEFLRVHGMLGRMQYLIGSSTELARTWSEWYVGSKREVGHPELVDHSALIYGISASGKLRTLYPSNFEPSQIVHDVPKLSAQ